VSGSPALWPYVVRVDELGNVVIFAEHVEKLRTIGLRVREQAAAVLKIERDAQAKRDAEKQEADRVARERYAARQAKEAENKRRYREMQGARAI
jgi:hypothetical protein